MFHRFLANDPRIIKIYLLCLSICVFWNYHYFQSKTKKCISIISFWNSSSFLLRTPKGENVCLINFFMRYEYAYFIKFIIVFIKFIVSRYIHDKIINFRCGLVKHAKPSKLLHFVYWFFFFCKYIFFSTF